MIDNFIETQVAKEIFGVDPGRSNGGIVKWVNGRYESWPIKKMPEDTDLIDFFKHQKSICELPLVFLEKINMYTGDFDNRGRMFQLKKLQDHYANLRTSLRTNELPFVEVMPMSWQKTLKIHIPNEESAVRKRRLKDLASDMYPGQNIVGWNADAYHLIEFGRTKLKYDLKWVLRKIKENTKTKTLF